MIRVFVSYDRADGEFVDELVKRIQSEGFEVWKDSHSLNAGDDWRAQIDEGIRQAAALIVVMTPEARESEYVSYEWACALGAGVKVIPVLLKTTDLHARLSAMHYLDFTNQEKRPWDHLVHELKKTSGSAADTPPIVKKAVDALDSLDTEEQSRAIRILTQIDHPSAREALAAAVRHHNKEIRIQAALELSLVKDPRAVPGLIDAQRWWQLRWEFVRRITPFGSAAVPELLKALADADAELREYAAHALGEIKDPSAVSALQVALGDAKLSVRDAATKALEKISPK
jgi:hypothetical protein